MNWDEDIDFLAGRKVKTACIYSLKPYTYKAYNFSHNLNKEEDLMMLHQKQPLVIFLQIVIRLIQKKTTKKLYQNHVKLVYGARKETVNLPSNCKSLTFK